MNEAITTFLKNCGHQDGEADHIKALIETATKCARLAGANEAKAEHADERGDDAAYDRAESRRQFYHEWSAFAKSAAIEAVARMAGGAIAGQFTDLDATTEQVDAEMMTAVQDIMDRFRPVGGEHYAL